MQRSLRQNDSLQRRGWPRSLLALCLEWPQRLQVYDERLQFLFCQLTREGRHGQEPHGHCGRRIQNRLAQVRFIHEGDSARRVLNRTAEQTVQRWADPSCVGLVATDTPTFLKERPSGSQCSRRLATDHRGLRSIRRDDARFAAEWLTACSARPTTRQRIFGFSGCRDEYGNTARKEHESDDDDSPSPGRRSASAGRVLTQEAIGVEEDDCREKIDSEPNNANWSPKAT
jgi:hypothetical protein